MSSKIKSWRLRSSALSRRDFDVFQLNWYNALKVEQVRFECGCNEQFKFRWDKVVIKGWDIGFDMKKGEKRVDDYSDRILNRKSPKIREVRH